MSHARRQALSDFTPADPVDELTNSGEKTADGRIRAGLSHCAREPYQYGQRVWLVGPTAPVEVGAVMARRLGLPPRRYRRLREIEDIVATAGRLVGGLIHGLSEGGGDLRQASHLPREGLDTLGARRTRLNRRHTDALAVGRAVAVDPEPSTRRAARDADGGVHDSKVDARPPSSISTALGAGVVAGAVAAAIALRGTLRASQRRRLARGSDATFRPTAPTDPIADHHLSLDAAGYGRPTHRQEERPPLTR